ncbi:MAG TPA: prolyl oligopeptidase family serine peptidase [Ignavibacteria bacterium]|nr:prolyl oligopeptidase family serine peptidase [Ignavibacteria bacterium]
MNLRKTGHIDIYHGKEISDPYVWMEDMLSDDVKNFVMEENSNTEKYLSRIPFRDKIRSRLTELADYTRYSSVIKAGEFIFYFKNDGLQNQDILYRQKGTEAEPAVFLDPNEFSSEGTIAVIEVSVSPDNRYLAYAISKDGSDWEEIFIMEIESGKKLDDCIKWVRYSSISWYKDGFFYNRYEEVKGDKFKEINKSPETYFHIPGELQSEDKLIFEDKEDAEKSFAVFSDQDQTFLFRTEFIKSKSGNRIFYHDLSPDQNLTDAVYIPLTEDHENEWNLIEADGRYLYFITNKDASRYKITKYNTSDKTFSDIIPENEMVIENAVIAERKLIVKYLKDAHNVIIVYDLNGNFENEIELPGIGTAIFNYTKKSFNEIFFTYSSFNRPEIILKYNISEKLISIFKENEIHYDADSIESKQVFYESKDGTKIPMFLIFRKGIELNGKNPVLLYGYGGFDISMTPDFKSQRILFIENGGIFAIASLRGGGEYGEEWHKAGMKLNKQNVFDDFISAAEYLIKNNYTSPDKLAAQGRSNGGLLIGAVINQRPELFKVALPAVGVMDMLKFHKFTIGWNWISDFGSSEDPAQFRSLLNYSPLHNIKPVNYPATLITTSDHDDRVVPLHSYKYAATLQELKTGNNPVLLRVGTNSGHGMGIPVSKAIDETTDIWSFVFYNLEMEIN